jgi:heat shock protein HslJ
MKYFLFSCLISIITCHNNPPVSINNTDTNITHSDSIPVDKESVKNETLDGEWHLQPVLASDTASGKIPSLNFDLKTNRVKGNTGCNSFSETFVASAESLHFNNNIVSTKMACPGYNEKAFVDNLLKTNRYQIKQGVLQLMYNTTVLSKWTRTVDTSINKEI